MDNLNKSGLIEVRNAIITLSSSEPDPEDYPFVFESNNNQQDQEGLPDEQLPQDFTHLSPHPSDLLCNSSYDMIVDSRIDFTEIEDRHSSKSVQPPLRMNCPICKTGILDATISPCFHSFCSFCIYEYLECYDQCPVCNSPVSIEKLKPNHSQNKAFLAALKRAKTIDKMQKIRIQHISMYWRARNVNSIEKDKLVDFKSRKNRWVQAKIVNVAFIKKETLKRIKVIVVVIYSIRDKHYKEYVKGDSARLASIGFFTQRRNKPTTILQKRAKSSQSCALLKNNKKKEESERGMAMMQLVETK